MFGHDHDDQNKDNVQPMSTQPVNNGLLGIDDDDSHNKSMSADPTPSAPPAPVGDDNFGDDTSASPQHDKATAASVSPFEDPSPTPSAPSTDANDDDSDDDLLGIKKEALEELSPLIDHLEQSSEDKFRTTMMMIQASDNKTLIPQAFKAARDIKDDAKRAQALLDIVNEINYFTHKNPTE